MIINKIKTIIFSKKDDEDEKIYKPSYIVKIKRNGSSVVVENVYDVVLKRDWSKKEISEAGISRLDGAFDSLSILNWNMDTRQDRMRTKEISNDTLVAYLCN